jgi:hypothetical protein
MQSINNLAVIVASIAALAGSVQAYVSWLGRNDTLKASILAEVVRQCSNIHVSSQALVRLRGENVRLLEDGKNIQPETVLTKDANELGGAVLAADAALHILNPKAPDIAALMDQLSEASKTYQTAKSDSRLNAVAAERQQFQATNRFLNSVNQACLTATRDYLNR